MVAALSGCDWCTFLSIGSRTAIKRVWQAGANVDREATAVSLLTSPRVPLLRAKHSIQTAITMFRHSIAINVRTQSTIHFGRQGVPVDATENTGDPLTGPRKTLVAYSACMCLGVRSNSIVVLTTMAGG